MEYREVQNKARQFVELSEERSKAKELLAVIDKQHKECHKALYDIIIGDEAGVEGGAIALGDRVVHVVQGRALAKIKDDILETDAETALRVNGFSHVICINKTKLASALSDFEKTDGDWPDELAKTFELTYNPRLSVKKA